jgi:hypothetical protein
MLEAGAGNREENFAEGGDTTADIAGATPISLVWQPAALTAAELSLLRRLIALRTDHNLATSAKPHAPPPRRLRRSASESGRVFTWTTACCS